MVMGGYPVIQFLAAYAFWAFLVVGIVIVRFVDKKFD